MGDLRFRRIRGLIIGILFLIMGFTLFQNPSQGTAAYINTVYPTEFLAAFFGLSGAMIAYGGWCGDEHNAIWYTPVFTYTLGVYVHSLDSGIPKFTVLVYTLLSVMFMLEIARDIIGGQNGR